MSDFIYLYQSLSLSASSHSVPSSSLTLTAITQHNIISPTALDIQDFFKPFDHLWRDVLPCHYDQHICGLISLSSWLFIWFLICGFVQVLFFNLIVNF